MTTPIDQQLEKLENLAQKKQKELDRENYNKYISVYTPGIKFLRKYDVLMYGGMALNELFPTEMKFYDDAVLPDIDVFCTDAIKLCNSLTETYKKQGYASATYKKALHENTYKFFAAGLQLLDITQISEDTFRQLKKDSIKLKKGLGIRIVNMDYLRLSLHALLSQPKDSHRWGKAFDRLHKFYELYPPKPSKCGESKKTQGIGKSMKDMSDDLLYLTTETPYVVFGGYALTRIVPDLPTGHFSHGTCMDLIVEGDTMDVATQFLTKLQTKYDSKDLSLSQVYPGNEIVCTHQYVLYKNKPCIGFYQPHMCVSYITKKHIRIASIHTLSRMYMMLALSQMPHHRRHGYRCMVEMITQLQVRLMRSSKKTHLLQQFALECYGEQPGLITLRRNLFEGHA